MDEAEQVSEINKLIDEVEKLQGHIENPLKTLAKLFEVDIYVISNSELDTCIVEKYIHSYDNSTIFIHKESQKYNPVAVIKDNVKHLIFFQDYDDDVISCVKMYDASGISDKVKINNPKFEVNYNKFYLNYTINEEL